MAKDISRIVPDAGLFDGHLILGLRHAVGHVVITTVAKARKEHRWQDRTFATRDSIDGDVRDLKKGARGHIWAGINAVRLNDGTPPHRIAVKDYAAATGAFGEGAVTNKRRKALRFTVGGAPMFRRAVNHPGTTPDPFLSAAEAFAEDELGAAAMRALDSALGF